MNSMKKFDVKYMVEISNFTKIVSENSGINESEIEEYLFETYRYPENAPVFFWNNPKYFDDDDKTPIMIAIYKTMSEQNINGLYVV